MTRARLLAALALAGLAPLAAGAAHASGDAAGTAAGGFLALGAGTSAVSMGGATLAGGCDLASAAWNPAALARIEALQLSLAHAPLPGGASQDWFAAGGRVGGSATRWGAQALFQREADLDGRDAANNPTGSFSATDVAVGLRLARGLGERVSAGLGLQWVHEVLGDVAGSGLAFEGGLRAEAGAFGFALAARNQGGTLRYPTAAYELPAVIAAGLSWSDPERGLRLNADFETPSHYYNSVRVGGEWGWRERVAVRAGYRLALAAPAEADASGAAFGFGASVGAMWVDYSFLPEGGSSTGEHRFGITFRPGLPGRAGVDGGRPERRLAEPRPPRTPRVAPVRTAPQAPPPAPPAATPARTVTGTPAKTSADSGTTAPARPTARASSAGGPPAAASKPAASKPAASPPATPPPAAAAPAMPSPPTPASMPVVRPAVVVVAAGETLADIARRWDTSVPAIMMVNDLVSDRVSVGQRLRLPPPRRR